MHIILLRSYGTSDRNYRTYIVWSLQTLYVLFDRLLLGSHLGGGWGDPGAWTILKIRLERGALKAKKG